MKKSKYPAYQPLPARSGSPLDRKDLERGGSSSEQAPSRPSFNPAALIGRKASVPIPNDLRNRGQRAGPSGKPLAPGQVIPDFMRRSPLLSSPFIPYFPQQ